MTDDCLLDDAHFAVMGANPHIKREFGWIHRQNRYLDQLTHKWVLPTPLCDTVPPFSLDE